MTKDEKKVLVSMAALLSFKAVLITSIKLTDRHYRKTMAQYAA